MTIVSTEQLGARVRELRQHRRLTQAALAEAADLASDTIARLEHARFSPSFDTLLKVADGLGITIIELMHDGDQADDLAVMIRHLPDLHKQVAFAVVGTLHVQAAVK